MSRFGALVTAAVIEGLFLAIHYKTEQDVSPSGIIKMIMDAFKPFMPADSEGLTGVLQLVVVIVPWFVIFLKIESLGYKKGFLIFIGAMIASFVLFQFVIN